MLQSIYDQAQDIKDEFWLLTGVSQSPRRYSFTCGDVLRVYETLLGFAGGALIMSCSCFSARRTASAGGSKQRRCRE